MVIEYVLVAIYFSLIGLVATARHTAKEGQFAWGVALNSVTAFPLWACLTFVGPLGIVSGFITMGIALLAIIVMVLIVVVVATLMGYKNKDVGHNFHQSIIAAGAAILIITILIML